MGSACCVAARDRTIPNGSNSETLHRNIRYSPSWSFRWDNRGRVAGEVETSVSWYSDGISRTDGLDTKSGMDIETAYISDGGGPLEHGNSYSEESVAKLRSPLSDISDARNISADVSVEHVELGLAKTLKEETTSQGISNSSPPKLSTPATSRSSFSTSPPSSQSQSNGTSSTPPRWTRNSPGSHLRSSYGGSSDNWSTDAFHHRESWSLDSTRVSTSPPVDLQTCGVCSKLLTEKSSWSIQKIISTNELSVVAVLICGHVYHAECLEYMTPSIDRCDPSCPVCTFGEKHILKLSEKVRRAEMELKVRNGKRSRNRVVDSDLDGDFCVYDRYKGSRREGKGHKMGPSSSMKSSFGKPFFRRHFSFPSKVTNSFPEDHSVKKKPFFWAKSSKE